MMARPLGRADAQAPCRACSTIESDEAWAALPLVQVLRAEHLRPLVTRWRARDIEVRTCARCGRDVARLVAART